MKKIDSKINGNITLSEDVQFAGLLSGSMEVHGKTVVNIFGIIGKDLKIQKDSVVKIYGVINGKISNMGTLDVFGMVNGHIENKGGNIRIHPDAMLKGTKVKTLQTL